MPLVVDQLPLWTIGFKWAGLDPNRLWLRIPSLARDNFSTLLEAILCQNLDCSTLQSEKYQGDDPQIAKFHIRCWIDEVYAAVHTREYNRKLLRWAVIEREAFRDWCNRCTIPLPEFWFPPGWSDYRWPEYDANGSSLPVVPLELNSAEAVLPESGSTAGVAEALATADAAPKELRDNQIARVASQQMARVIWKDEPDRTIAAMCKDDRILKYGGAQYYAEDVVRRWIKVVAPVEVSAKRGRPRKQNPTEYE